VPPPQFRLVARSLRALNGPSDMAPALPDSFAGWIGTALAAAAAAYAWVALAAGGRGARSNEPLARGGPAQPVSVLKPLHGAEPGLYENLRSFCAQTHPRFQILFGVRDSGDPAAGIVRRLQSEFPEGDLQLVVDPRVHGTNPKVGNLLNLAPHARHPWLVIADSDIAVAPDYLARVTAPLADPDVGVVTCLYRGAARGGYWAVLGAMFIDEWFVPSARVAHAFGSRRFGFGATLAVRKDVLAEAGGFEALKDRLADDFWLAEFTRRAGRRTLLSDVIVATDVTEDSLAALWRHEVRWMRTIRGVAPAGFAFSFVTCTLPVLALGAAFAGSRLGWFLAGFGAAGRLLLSARQAPAGQAGLRLLLAPIRDALLIAEWAAAHLVSRVRWREQVFHANREGRPASPS
jgi:ceramide glucosyltransferase